MAKTYEEEQELKVTVLSKAARKAPATYAKRLAETKTDEGRQALFKLVNREYEMLSLIEQSRRQGRYLNIRAFIKNKLAMTALVLLVITVLLGIIMPFTTGSPTYLSPDRHVPPLDKGYILGTDLAGRDLWARLWHGLQFTLGIVAFSTLLNVVVGISIGLLMGYYSWIDKALQFVIKALNNIPTFFILTLLVLALDPSFFVIVFAMLISGWVGMAQYVRTEVLRYKSMEFTIAEQSLGASSFSILKTYLPLMTPIIAFQLVLSIPSAVYFDVFLSFVGLGIPNQATLGNVLQEATTAVSVYPLEVIWPTLMITTFVIYVQFIGNGVDEVISGGRRRVR